MSDSTSLGIDSFSELTALIKARVPIIWVLTHEERRFMEQLYNDVTKAMSIPTFVWSSWQGMMPIDFLTRGTKQDIMNPNTALSVKALEYIASAKVNEFGAIYILRDFHTVLQTQEVRILRDLYDKNADTAKIIIIVSPSLGHGPGGTRDGLPPTLEKQVAVIDYELPKHDDIVKHTKGIIKSIQNEIEGSNRKVDTKFDYTDADYEEVARAIRGLTRVEIENAIATCLALTKRLDPNILLQNKKQVIKRSQILEYIDTSVSMDDVGGLDNVKNYLIRYTKAFSKEAKQFGVEPLRAVLFTGIAGTGKSLTGKAIGNLWKLPLLRLDVGRVMGSLVGSSEARMREVISTLEAISPCCVGDTKLLLQNTEISIEDFYFEQRYFSPGTQKILTFNPDKKIFEYSTILRCIRRKRKPRKLIKITTEQGSIVVTSNHKFLTTTGQWIEAKNIKVGLDLVELPKK